MQAFVIWVIENALIWIIVSWRIKSSIKDSIQTILTHTLYWKHSCFYEPQFPSVRKHSFNIKASKSENKQSSFKQKKNYKIHNLDRLSLSVLYNFSSESWFLYQMVAQNMLRTYEVITVLQILCLLSI